MRLLTIIHLTIFDALRRRILQASLLMGALLVLVFGIAMYFVARQLTDQATPFLLRQAQYAGFVLAGLFATNFLSVMFALMLPVDALSGEIASGVMQTIACKPLRRFDIVVGKWAAYWLVVAGYLLLVGGGVILGSRLMTGYMQANLAIILSLMLLEVTLLLTVSIAGGTQLSTVTNGIVAIGFYGIAFIGGWVEQIGALANIAAAKNVGVAVSLISPADSMWRLAAYYAQPSLLRAVNGTPFSSASVPNAWMVWWAAGFTVLTLAYAVRQFSRRPL